jgi:hypothetical protein
MANTFGCSDGSRVTTRQIEEKMRVAKAQLLQNQFEEFGYNFCEECGNNGSGKRLHCSHDISVKKAKEEGKAELCWKVGNMTVLCEDCHQVKDGLDIQWS